MGTGQPGAGHAIAFQRVAIATAAVGDQSQRDEASLGIARIHPASREKEGIAAHFLLLVLTGCVGDSNLRGYGRVKQRWLQRQPLHKFCGVNRVCARANARRAAQSGRVLQ